jgi:hypothetical protein
MPTTHESRNTRPGNPKTPETLKKNAKVVLDNGIKVVAARRGEAAAVVVREILREGLELRGVITLQHSHGSPVQPLQPTAGAAE